MPWQCRCAWRDLARRHISAAVCVACLDSNNAVLGPLLTCQLQVKGWPAGDRWVGNKGMSGRQGAQQVDSRLLTVSRLRGGFRALLGGSGKPAPACMRCLGPDLPGRMSATCPVPLMPPLPLSLPPPVRKSHMGRRKGPSRRRRRGGLRSLALCTCLHTVCGGAGRGQLTLLAAIRSRPKSSCYQAVNC